MAQKKTHSYKAAASGEVSSASEVKYTQAKPVGNATGLRIGAAVCWLAAIGLEVLAYLLLIGKVNLKFMPTLYQAILAIVLDLVLVVVGSQLWKKANRIKPASKKNKVLFWLWNNMGFLVAVLAFLPLIVLVLVNKDMDKKTKTIVTAVAAIALILGGLGSYDFDPVSAEEQNAAIETISGDVFWTQFGKVYHTHDDCQALNRTDELTYGTVEQAIAANRTRLCSFCAKRDSIEGVRTDDVPVDDVLDVVTDNAA